MEAMEVAGVALAKAAGSAGAKAAVGLVAALAEGWVGVVTVVAARVAARAVSMGVVGVDRLLGRLRLRCRRQSAPGWHAPPLRHYR